MDHRSRIVRRLEARVDNLARTTARAVIEEVPGFGPIRDDRLGEELLSLANQGIGLLVEVLRHGERPSDAQLSFMRERAVRRARELVPLAALMHAYLIANRTVCGAIAEEAGATAASTQAALALTAEAFEYTILTATVMADAYIDTVQGDIADLAQQRRDLLDTVLATGTGTGASAELTRRATGLGLHHATGHVVVVAAVREMSGAVLPGDPQRWAAEAITRACGRSEREAFVVIRGSEIVALLRSDGSHAALRVLEDARVALRDSRALTLTAGIGPPFGELTTLGVSYDEARRALRHTSAQRPFVSGPADVLLFDELTASAGATVADLVPDRTRLVLRDPIMRSTLEAFATASLNIAGAAQALHVHPNTLRYRLRRIATRTGRDPRTLADLFELLTAIRVLAAAP